MVHRHLHSRDNPGSVVKQILLMTSLVAIGSLLLVKFWSQLSGFLLLVLLLTCLIVAIYLYIYQAHLDRKK